jgi:hypothetical protein
MMAGFLAGSCLLFLFGFAISIGRFLNGAGDAVSLAPVNQVVLHL